MNRIIIIGTGNIGKRHLQGISSLEETFEIFCHDSYKTSLESVHTFCESNNINSLNITLIESLEETLSNINEQTIIILATTAKGRKDLLVDCIKKEPLAIIAEKPIVQTIEEYDEIIELNKKFNIPVYVDFSDHMFPGYQKIYSEIKNSEKININFNFQGDVGLACNGIHYIELISWMTNMKKYEIINSQLFEVFDSKRVGFKDFTGSISFLVNDKHTCSVIIDGEKSANSVQIVADNKLFLVFEFTQKMISVENDAILTEEFPIPFTSQITDKVVKNIFDGQNSYIPLMEEVYLPHKLLFKYMSRHKISDLNIT